MLKVLMIASGGAFGSVLRYGVQAGTVKLLGGVFPLGTLIVNVVGCFAIGVMAGALSGAAVMREEYRVGIMVGVLGGFTTFSSFGLETFALARMDRFGLAMVNVVLSCGICLTAVAIGFRSGALIAR